MRLRPLLLLLIASRAYSQPASLAGFSEEGIFAFYANEDRVGTVTYSWKPNGKFEAKCILTFANQQTVSTVTLTPDAEGRWVKALIEDPAKKTVWERNGPDYKFTTPDFSRNGRWPPDSVSFESYTPPLITAALRRYSASEGGRQSLPVIPLNVTTLSANLEIERLETKEFEIGGNRLRLTHWVFAPPGYEYQVLAGPDSKVYAVSGIPGIGQGISPHHAIFVREGYESLLKEFSRETGPDSRPVFEVEVTRGAQIPLRDGVKLSTDIYLPRGAAKAPVILIRTPYKKEMEELQGRFFARRGYVVAAQDVRGRFASEGEWEPFIHEAKDGYDTIEWLARQPWSSGKVGMIGASYLGWVQWWAASQHPPHLAAMIPNVSPPDPFHNLPFDSGVLEFFALHWMDIVESKATADISGITMAALDAKNNSETSMHLPVMDLDKAVLGHQAPYWGNWMRHPTPDKYWSDTLFADKLKDFDIPVFHQSGWFDGDAIGTKLNYLKMASFGHKLQKLTVGPWGHDDSASQVTNRVDFSPAAAIDLEHEYLRWFDRYLKGIDNGIDREPPVSLFVMGSNTWVHAPSYPLPETQYEKLYLNADGVLSFSAPGAKQSPDHYTYDPADPTPEEDINSQRRAEIEKRSDMLVYTTAPFEKPYTFAGPVSAVLYAATSARDTDWFIHVVEVDEKGAMSPLWASGSGGHIRARYRNSLTKAELLNPGRIYEYRIDLWHTAVTLPAGHRLRIEVASAGFAAHERNLNTGGNNETETRFVKADQTIYHDGDHPSHILLPRIPTPGN